MNVEDNIRSINEIPPFYQRVFKEYPCFNIVQSSVLDDVLHTDKSLVVSAPTGSGKTAIFELAIIRLLMLHERDSILDVKIIYISPIKALCRERLIDWHKKFSEYGIKCISLTSDTDDVDAKNISHYNLIISTPEKWDVITRRWRDNQKLIASISLFMIDETHLLNVDSRGPTLEVIVSRMKTAESLLLLNQEKTRIRFIALSATIPNVEDIAQWIEPTGTAKYFKFSKDVRPVKLEKIVIGFDLTSKTFFMFDISLNYKLPNLISKYSKQKPTLIFCSTRKCTEMTTTHLVANLQIRLSDEQKKVLYQIAQKISDAKLKQFIIHGIAMHHAGLLAENRNIIESSFREGHLPILVTTSTLAMGVNLPAHLVIVKGTKRYDSNEGYKDYDEVSIFQMIGRAGRIQFDTSATALILTTIQDKHKYEQMLDCTQNIESNLHKHLTEHLNAEIVLRTITDLEVAMRWLSSTFLYVRAKKCPEKYKLPAGLPKERTDKKLLEICQIDLNKLVRAGMIEINEAIEMTPTVVGEIMAKYYIAFQTMELFTKVSGNEIIMQLLSVMAKCHEFSEVYLRTNDKKCLNLLNKNTHKETIRFPLSGRIKTVDMKINCIIQAVLGNLDISDPSILNDSVRVMKNCVRLAKCLIEYLETRRQCHAALLNAIILAKCFEVKLWENSPYVSKQLTGVGRIISTLLVKAGKTTFKEIIKTNPRHLETIVGRKPPFGSTLVDEASHLPEYKIILKRWSTDVNLEIELLNPKIIEEKSTLNLNSTMILLVGDSDNNVLLYEKYSHSYMLDHPKVIRSIRIDSESINYITANLISEDWVGIDCYGKLEISEKGVSKIDTPKKTKQTFMDMYVQNDRGTNTVGKQEDPKITSSKYKGDQSINLESSKTIPKEKRKKTKKIKDDLDKENNDSMELPKFNDHTRPLKKETKPKKKQILVSKSIFHTPSKIKPMKKPQKPSELTKIQNADIESEIQKNITFKDEGPMSSCSTYSHTMKISDEASIAKRNDIDNDSTISRIESSYTDTNKRKDISFSQNKCITSFEKDATDMIKNNNRKKNNTPRKNKSKLYGTLDLNRRYPSKNEVADNEYSSFEESLMHQVFDDYEKNKIGIGNKEEHNVEIINNKNTSSILKQLTAIYDNKSCLKNKDNLHNDVLSGPDTDKNNSVVSDESSEIECFHDNSNKNEIMMKKIDELKSYDKSIVPKLNGSNNSSGVDKYIANEYGVDGYRQSPPKRQSNIRRDNDETELKSSTHCLMGNKEDKNFLRSNFDGNDNHKALLSEECASKKSINKSMFSEVFDPRLLTNLYNKYNMKADYHGSQKNIDEERGKSPIIEMKNTNKSSQITMKNSESNADQLSLGREHFLSPYPKRFKIDENFSSPFNEAQPKSIKWRSPLVHSSPGRFSPNLPRFSFGENGPEPRRQIQDRNDLHIGSQDTSGSSINLNISGNSQKSSNRANSQTNSKKKLKLPLCDQDYISESFSNKEIKPLEDICDLEYFGLINRQMNSQKDADKKSSRSTSLAGEYYNQLMSTQHKIQSKNENKISEMDESIEKRILSHSDLENLQKCPSLASKSIVPDHVIKGSQRVYRPSQGVSQKEFISSQDNRQITYYHQDYVPTISSQHCLEDLSSYSNPKYVDNLLFANQDQPYSKYPTASNNFIPTYNEFQKIHHSREEFAQRYYGNTNNYGYPIQPNPYVIYNQPINDGMIFRQEISPPLHNSTVNFNSQLRHPIPRYANFDPYFSDPNVIFEPNYLVKQPKEIDPRFEQIYHSPRNRVSDNYDRIYSQQLDARYLTPIMNNKIDVQGHDINNFSQAYDMTENRARFQENDRNGQQNQLMPLNLYQQETSYPRIALDKDEANFVLRQRSSNQRLIRSQMDTNSQIHSNSSDLQQNFNRPVNYPENISKMFAPTPKRQLVHDPKLNFSQSQQIRYSLNPGNKIVNSNSFEERLDNMISPRHQSSTISENLPETQNQSISHPKDQELMINRLRYSNKRYCNQ